MIYLYGSETNVVFNFNLMCLALFSTEAFEKLLERLKGTQDGADQLELIKRAISVNTFSSDQGREVMDVMPTTFDKVGSGKGIGKPYLGSYA